MTRKVSFAGSCGAINGRAERTDHEDRDQNRSDDRARVVAEAVPRLVPESAARLLELDLDGFELGDDSGVPDPRVDDRVQDVHDEVDEDEDQGEEEDAALQDRVVAVEDRVA